MMHDKKDRTPKSKITISDQIELFMDHPDTHFPQDALV